jgi:hypothetical protein
MQTRRSNTLHLIAHVEDKFVPNVLFDTVTNCCIWRHISLVKQELITLPEHLSSSPVFSGVGVTPYLVLCVFIVDRCLSFCTFSFGHCVVCSSSIYGFWLPLWYLRTPRTDIINKKNNNKKQNKNTTSEQNQNHINGDKIDTLNTHIDSRLRS